jgi:hypothetical protein
LPVRPRRELRSNLAAAAAFAALSLFAGSHARAQEATTSDKLRISGETAASWVEGDRKVLLVEKDVKIVTDDATMTADRAVIWLANTEGNYRVEVALQGNARVVRGDLTREGGELFVSASVRPDVQLDVTELNAIDRSTDVHYLAAAQLRRQAQRGETATPITPALPVDLNASTQPTTGPTTRRDKGDRRQPVQFSWKHVEMSKTPDGKVALAISGGMFLVQTRPNGDRVELQADNAVLFTRFNDTSEMFEGARMKAFDADLDLDSVYLEGDVRMDVTPGDPKRAQQTLHASRIVYEFGADRAILTDALLHSLDPGADAPLVVRARAMRKLGTDHYEALSPSITTSSFATPSLSISATKVTVRQNDGNRGTSFVAENVTPRLYGVPFFYFPRLWGSDVDGIAGLRAISLSNSSGFGTGISTQWGLFETFGIEKPQNLDASYRLDYYSDRGPAGGIDANYSGGGINENTLQPFGFQGNITSYLAYDDGNDKLGKRRFSIAHEEDLRGRFKWDHQQFLTDGWQMQARLGYVSDGTFEEEWFRNEFRNGLPIETSLYVKRSDQTEVFSALIGLDTSNVPTIADQLQEVTVDDGFRYPLFVEKLPEVQYHRLGDSFGENQFTFVSNNSASALRFSKSYDSLESDLGIRRRTNPVIDNDPAFAGLPSYAYTGYTDDVVFRGDTRQEIAMPMGNDKVRVTPYGIVRYTAYSDSPGGGSENRLLGGVGVRTSTQFSKVYDDFDSKLFDIHRVRHIVEPQVNLFASAQTTDRNDVFIYDEGVDGVSDIAAAQFAVRQRFQTKRGGEGRWRSIDFLTFNSGVTFFANKPDEPEQIGSDFRNIGDAHSFRGIYFNSLPEASLARSTAFADATWRVSDTTAVLGDIAVNVDDVSLATTAIGVAIQRDPRVRYFAGVRYIGEINSTIGTITFDYDISTRYSIGLNQSIDLNDGQSQNTSLELTRKFEQFLLTVNVYFDRIEDDNGITIQFSPRNLPFSGPSLNGPGTRR